MDHADLPPLLHYCGSCEARVVFTPIYVHERVASDGRDEEYTLAGCSICGEPALFYRDEVEFQESVLNIPEAQFHRLWESLPRGLSFPVPPSVDIPYVEACEAELLHLPMSAAVMIGRALEAMCKDLEPNSGSIHQALLALRERGAVSEEMFQWASELRLLRNIAAHASDQLVSESEVEAALDFLEAILEIVYHIRPKFHAYMGRYGNSS
jgi:hypothetical protein